jgi:hypothetical protein
LPRSSRRAAPGSWPGSTSVDEVIPFEKALFDRPLAAPRSAPAALALARQIRGGAWDALVLFHHLTTPFGVAKYAALAVASGAPVRAGLDNGRGWFLTRRVRDDGFGARHEVDYWLAVAEALGGHNPISAGDRVTAEDRAWASDALAGPGWPDARWRSSTRAPAPSAWLGAGPSSGSPPWPASSGRGTDWPSPSCAAPAPTRTRWPPGSREASEVRHGLPVVGPTPTLGALVALRARRVFVVTTAASCTSPPPPACR